MARRSVCTCEWVDVRVHEYMDTCDVTRGYLRRQADLQVLEEFQILDLWMCVTWLMDMCGVTCGYVWRDAWKCATWLMDTCDVTHGVCVVWRIALWEWRDDSFKQEYVMTRSYRPPDPWGVFALAVVFLWHVSWKCAMWLMNMSGVTHSYVRMTWQTHPYRPPGPWGACAGGRFCVTHELDSRIHVMGLMDMCDVTHGYI